MLIVLYSGYNSTPWNPLSFVKTGLGGTEQCIMSLANNLLLGTNEIYVVGNVIEGDYNNAHLVDSKEKVKNFVKYRSIESFKTEIGNKKIDWIIAASYIHYLKEFEDLNYDQSIFWVHNTDFYPWWRGKELPNKGIDLLLHPKLTHIVCLTKWHKNKFIEQFPKSANKIQVIGNGLNLLEIFQGKAVPEYTERKKLEKYLTHEDSFSAKTSAKNRGSRINIKYFEKIPNQFVYTSHAERGLAKVLEDWPSIKQKFPNASLKISTPEYGLEYFEDNFLSLLDNLDDVEFLGTLGRQEYIELLKSSEYWYYPSNYEETFCITALEMLACMVKPVTYEAAGLKETLHGFNLEDFDDEIDIDAANYWAWRNRWSVVTEKWLKLIKKDTMIDFVYVTTIENNHDYVTKKTNQLNIPNDWKYWVKDGFNAKDFTSSFFTKNNIKKNKSSQIMALWPYLIPYKREAILALIALAITSMMILCFGKAVKYIIDIGFVKQNQAMLNLILLGFVVAVLIMAIAGYYRSFLINSVAEKMIADLRKKVYDHVIRVSAEFFESTKTGDVISRLSVDSALVINLISNTLPFLIRNSLLFCGGFLFLFTTSFKLSLISMLLILIAILPIIFLGRVVKNLSKKNQIALASVSAHIEESINGVKTIQSYLCEDKEVISSSGSYTDKVSDICLSDIQISNTSSRCYDQWSSASCHV